MAYRSKYEAFVGREEFGLTVSADEALAEAHTQTQEKDGCHTAHREEDDHGWIHYGRETHTLTHCSKALFMFLNYDVCVYDIWTKHVR